MIIEEIEVRLLNLEAKVEVINLRLNKIAETLANVVITTGEDNLKRIEALINEHTRTNG